jgi:enoyl-CoA hydratase/carnithine racemase
VRLLDSQMRLLDHAKHVRFIMLRGAGTNLCGGADLSMLHTASKMGEEGRQYIRSFFREQYVWSGSLMRVGGS